MNVFVDISTLILQANSLPQTALHIHKDEYRKVTIRINHSDQQY